ncbi:MAG: TIGR03067 domain-containing protein [Gemmataceae bacterium]|nr:TIGR03067 domain-containing protein [Gemmataceae bacterium]MCI0739818.1 TIGR03067 domain-containing protein [Gemmataceae bacterium]
MRALFAFCACALVLTLCPFGTGQDKKQLDPGKLVGKWKYVSGEKDGAKVDIVNYKDDVVTITKDTITLKGKETFVMKMELDAKKSPATVKLTMTESPFGPGAISNGIIELSGDDLKICYAHSDADAPKEFKTKEGGKQHLFVLKRAK